MLQTEAEIIGAEFHRAEHVKNVLYVRKQTVISAPVLRALSPAVGGTCISDMPNPMWNRIGSFGAWLAILFAVLAVISLFTFNMGLAGSGAGTGVFSYSFRAGFQISYDEDIPTFGTINIKGNASPRFMLWGNASPKYPSAEIDWLLFQKKESSGHALLDLDHMLIVEGSKSICLDANALSNLFGISSTAHNDKVLATAVFDFLQAAQNGNLPPPRHHGHTLPEPFPGRMQHGASGMSLCPLELIWVAVWSALGLRRLIKSRHIEHDIAELA